MGCVAVVVSGVILATYGFSLYYDYHYQPRIGHDYYAYKLVMLTNLDFVSFLPVLWIPAGPSNGLCPPLLPQHLPRGRSGSKKTREPQAHDGLRLLHVSLPCRRCASARRQRIHSQTTCALYWGLYAIEPQLVQPQWALDLIPQWLNHVTHTLPGVSLLVDTYLSHHTAPSRRQSIQASILLVAVYFAM